MSSRILLAWPSAGLPYAGAPSRRGRSPGLERHLASRAQLMVVEGVVGGAIAHKPPPQKERMRLITRWKDDRQCVVETNSEQVYLSISS
jgi:hypothetical protein